jgi:Putative zinc-finger
MSLFSCKDTVSLASAALDRELTIGQRVALRVHLLMCPCCTRFHQHLEFLRNAARRLEGQATAGDVEQTNLSPQARDRMQRALEQGSDKRSPHADLEP